MAPVVIAPAFPGITLINVFEPVAGRAEEFAALQVAELRRLAPEAEGYVSASLHLSLDRTRVANYAQFRDEAAFAAWRASPAFRDHLARIRPLIAGGWPHLYRIVGQVTPGG